MVGFEFLGFRLLPYLEVPVFFFVYSYSHATLLDHGGVLVNHFPVCRPLAGSVAAPSPPKPSAYPPALFPLPPGIEPRV